MNRLKTADWFNRSQNNTSFEIHFFWLKHHFAALNIKQ